MIAIKRLLYYYNNNNNLIIDELRDSIVDIVN